MNSNKETIKELKKDAKAHTVLEDRFSLILSELYHEKNLEVEREKKIIIERFTSSLKGKSIVLENYIPA
jgi:hypothetical protein